MMLPAKRPKIRSGIERSKVMRSQRHLKWLRTFVCCCCGDDGRIEAAHVRNGTDGSLSEKPSDPWAVPLSAVCHERQHRKGERTFWRESGKNPHKLAIEFAMNSPDKLVKQYAATMKDKW